MKVNKNKVDLDEGSEEHHFYQGRTVHPSDQKKMLEDEAEPNLVEGEIKPDKGGDPNRILPGRKSKHLGEETGSTFGGKVA